MFFLTYTRQAKNKLSTFHVCLILSQTQHKMHFIPNLADKNCKYRIIFCVENSLFFSYFSYVYFLSSSKCLWPRAIFLQNLLSTVHFVRPKLVKSRILPRMHNAFNWQLLWLCSCCKLLLPWLPCVRILMSC